MTKSSKRTAMLAGVGEFVDGGVGAGGGVPVVEGSAARVEENKSALPSRPQKMKWGRDCIGRQKIKSKGAGETQPP